MTQTAKIKNQIEKILLPVDNITYSFSGESDSNGRSIYYRAYANNKEVKLRFSNHSITNLERMRTEVCLPIRHLENQTQINDFIAELCYKLSIEGYDYGKKNMVLRNGTKIKAFKYYKK